MLAFVYPNIVLNNTEFLLINDTQHFNDRVDKILHIQLQYCSYNLWLINHKKPFIFLQTCERVEHSPDVPNV